MVMGKRSDLTVSQRREVVLMLLGREEPAAKLARRFGVSEPTLYRWRDDFLAGGEAALSAGKGQHDPRDRENAELKRQLAQRDQVIGELTIANRILKKTADGLY
jgi:transposase-like protein